MYRIWVITDDVVVIVPSLLDMVVALVEVLAHPTTVEVGPEGNVVRSTRRGVWCAQGAYFLGCTRLRVTADSLLDRDRWFALRAGPSPSSRLGLVRHGAG